MFQWFVFLISTVVCVNTHASDQIMLLSDRENGTGIDEWQPKVFLGETVYTPINYKKRWALKAVSHTSASGLVLKTHIDLIATPYLNWSWLVEKTLSPLDERNKRGDDFAARVYVILDGGLFFWKTLSLNYVWSSNQTKGLLWDNAFAGSNVKMMSVQGLQSKKSQWYQEKRNVYQDLIHTFGDKGTAEANQKAYRYIDSIAIMTDTDNSGKAAESYYSGLFFSKN